MLGIENLHRPWVVGQSISGIGEISDPPIITLHFPIPTAIHKCKEKVRGVGGG